MKIYEAIAEALEAEGCRHFFGVMGDGNMYLWASVQAKGRLKTVMARHENAAVNMADGYARTTGRVGIVSVTHGPGLTHVGTALTTAARARTPLVLLVGEYPEHGSRLQWSDQKKFVEACEGRYVRLTHRNTVARDIADAFYQARLHRMPVALGMDVELQEQDLPAPFAYRPSAEFLPAVASPPASPPEGALEPLIDAILAAERPVILAGRGARIAGARDALVALGDRIGALLATSLLNKEFFAGCDYDVGISGGWASSPTQRLLKQSDLVIAFGAEVGWFTNYGGTVFKAKLARIDIAPGRDSIGFNHGLYISGDARATAEKLDAMLAERQIRKTGFRTPATLAELEPKPVSWPQPAEGLDPRAVLQRLAPVLPKHLLASMGVGHYSGFVAVHLPLPEGAEFNSPIHFGAIGQGLPFAIGVGIGQPDRPHLFIEGDGSLLMCLQELETAARSGLQLVVLVMNDGGFGAEFQKLRLMKMAEGDAIWPSPDFVAVARALGGDGVKLTHEDQIAEAAKEGFRRGGLFLIDVPTARDALTDQFMQRFGLGSEAPLLRRPQG